MMGFSTIILMTSWLFSSMQLSHIISSEIIALFSLKIPNKQIECLEDLLKSDMKTIVASHVENVQDNSPLKQIIQNSDRDKTKVELKQLVMDKKWIVDTSKGKTAILYGTVPLRIIILLHLSDIAPGTKFRYLQERFTHPMLITLFMSRKLSWQFRKTLNHK